MSLGSVPMAFQHRPRARVFVILGFSDASQMGARIADLYPDNFLDIGLRRWLVAAPGTTKDVSDKVLLQPGSGMSGIVVGVESYFGIASPEIWEWLTTKLSGRSESGG